MKRASFVILFTCLGLCLGCSSIYYATMEKLGKEKREILVDRVSDIRKRQERAKEQFKTTLEAFQEVTGIEGGDLEKLYKKLDREYERSNQRAEGVQDRIRSIEKVARDLFREWRREINEIQDTQLRSKSQRLLNETEQHYEAFAVKLHQTEEDGTCPSGLQRPGSLSETPSKRPSHLLAQGHCAQGQG
jgi:Skp family chaperone for outer membrane proteins